MAKSVEEVVYLIEFENAKRQRITVPASWKVTFGPAASGINKEFRGKVPLALRFYENETKQRAIFTDVVGFRDLSIKIEEERTNIQEKDAYVECEGKRKRTTLQAKTTEWVNPDTPLEPKLLSSGDEEE